MFSDNKVVVYLGYPSEDEPIPGWMHPMLQLEQQNPGSSDFHFYLSGGAVTPSLLPTLLSRANEAGPAQLLAMKLAQGYTTRLVDALLSPNLENISKLAAGSPRSTEYRILLDLWVLSRSDVYVVDCELLGRGSCGMEAVYAHHCVRTVGVSDSSSIDPWYQYHLDLLVKSPMAMETLKDLRHTLLAGRIPAPGVVGV